VKDAPLEFAALRDGLLSYSEGGFLTSQGVGYEIDFPLRLCDCNVLIVIGQIARTGKGKSIVGLVRIATTSRH
jgi:hypothetical protein